MENPEENKEQNKKFRKTQSTSSPGALGEDANRKKTRSYNPEKKKATDTTQEEGLNQERSTGNAGAFEGLENTGDG